MDAFSQDLFSTESREPLFLGVTITTSLLLYITVTLRFLCKTKTGAGLWYDDWLILSATIFQFTEFIFSLTTIRNYIGHHAGVVDPNGIETFSRIYFYCELCYPLILMLIKLSILALYWRVFSAAARWPMIVMGVANTLWGVTLFLVIVFQCKPISDGWHLLNPDRNCLDFKKLLIGGPIFHILQDGILMLMPLPYIFGLHMRLTQKIFLSLIFMLGGFIIFVSILRVVIISRLNLSNLDMTWTFTDLTIWTAVELDIAGVCACLPCLRPIITVIKTGSFVRAPSAPSGGRTPEGTNSRRSDRKPFKWSVFSTMQSDTVFSDEGGKGPMPTMVSKVQPEADEKAIVVTTNWNVETQRME